MAPSMPVVRNSAGRCCHHDTPGVPGNLADKNALHMGAG